MFGKKEKSPKKCPNCKTPNTFTPFNDLVTCPKCDTQFATGYEDSIRKQIEKDCNGTLKYPRFAVARAIGYSSAIYGMATHDEDFDGIKIENQLKKLVREDKSFQGGSTGQVKLVQSTQMGRSMSPRRGLVDQRHGYLMTVVTGAGFQQIYIAFRGSRSDTGNELNPQNAGFDQTGQNVDYAANFTGRYDPPPWAASGNIRIRRGFLELYESMAQDILHNLDGQLHTHPNAQVIVTGHSLGAGLAVVCAHHLQHQRINQIAGDGLFCYPFCTPRTGNAEFCWDFKQRLAEAERSVPGEPSSKSYKRAINFVMSNDPVSTKAAYGFLHDRTDDADSQGTEGARRGFIGKVAYGLTKKENKRIIFYQTPNLYKLGFHMPWNIHQYSRMQEHFMGKALYKT